MSLVGKEVFQIIRQFSFKSIFFKYWKKFTCIIIIPFMILNAVIYFAYRKLINARISSTAAKSTSVAADTLSRQLVNADKSFLLLSTNPLVTSYLMTPQESSGYDITQIRSAMLQCTARSPELQSIYIYNPMNQYVLSTHNGNYLRDFTDKAWYEHYAASGTTTFAIRNTLPVAAGQTAKEYLTLCYGIYIQNIFYGLVVINFNFDSLDKLLPKNDSFFLLDEDGTLLYATDRTVTTETFHEHFTYTSPENTTDGTVTMHHSNGMICAACALDIRPYTLVSAASLTAYSEQASFLRLLLIGALLLTALLPTALALYISLSFYHSIMEIIDGFSSVELNSHSKEYSNEINFITRQIMKLSSQNQHIENELANKMALLKKAQLSAMQMQFNQHFLFNTLNMISMSARTEARGKNPISTSIALLSDLLRISLDTKQYLVSIAAEVMYSKKYLEIEQIKLKNAFEVVWDIDEALYEYKTVKLMFQPILENALRYGLQPKPAGEPKTLIIRGRMSADTIEFHVIDNGVGFTSEALTSFRKAMHEGTQAESKHIGLSNVNTRIKLIFGNTYGLNISSDASGTDVSISIPAAKNA